MNKTLTLISALALSACGATQPTPAQIQNDLQIALNTFKTAGCIVQAASVAAAPIVAIEADAQGNKVLTAVSATSGLVCTASAPPSIVSAPGTTLGAIVPQ